MSNVLHLLHAERVFRTDFSLSGSKALIRPEQKNMVRMKNIICKFSLPGGLVVDCCVGTFLVGKPYMQLSHHRRFFGRDLHSECVASILPQLAPFFDS